jgi:hypothetical protein
MEQADLFPDSQQEPESQPTIPEPAQQRVVRLMARLLLDLVLPRDDEGKDAGDE